MATLEVGAGKDYSTMAAAISAAASGDTIYLYDDIAEQINITKSLSIRGIADGDGNRPKVSISASSTPALSVAYNPSSAETVTVENIDFETNAVFSDGVFLNSANTTLYVNKCSIVLLNDAVTYCINVDAGTSAYFTYCYLERGGGHASIVAAPYVEVTETLTDGGFVTSGGAPDVTDTVEVATEGYGPEYGSYLIDWSPPDDTRIIDEGIGVSDSFEGRSSVFPIIISQGVDISDSFSGKNATPTVSDLSGIGVNADFSGKNATKRFSVLQSAGVSDSFEGVNASAEPLIPIQTDTPNFAALVGTAGYVESVVGGSDEFHGLSTALSQTEAILGYELGGNAVCSAFFRFYDIQIPKDAVILSASLSLYLSSTDYISEAVRTKISVGITDDLAENPLTDQISSYEEWTAETRSVSFVEWEFDTSTESTVNIAPDIADVIQEAVGKAHWGKGCSLNFFLDDNGTPTDAQNYLRIDFATAPTLTVEFMVIRDKAFAATVGVSEYVSIDPHFDSVVGVTGSFSGERFRAWEYDDPNIVSISNLYISNSSRYINGDTVGENFGYSDNLYLKDGEIRPYRGLMVGVKDGQRVSSLIRVSANRIPTSARIISAEITFAAYAYYEDAGSIFQSRTIPAKDVKTKIRFTKWHDNKPEKYPYFLYTPEITTIGEYELTPKTGGVAYPQPISSVKPVPDYQGLNAEHPFVEPINVKNLLQEVVCDENWRFDAGIYIVIEDAGTDPGEEGINFFIPGLIRLNYTYEVFNNIKSESIDIHGNDIRPTMADTEPMDRLTVGCTDNLGAGFEAFSSVISIWNVQVPRGATVLSSRLRFSCTYTREDDDPPIQIGISAELPGEEDNNHDLFVDTVSSHEEWDNALKTGSVIWNWDKSCLYGSFGIGYETKSPEISKIIQEIIDHPAWIPGGRINFFLDSKNACDIEADNFLQIANTGIAFDSEDGTIGQSSAVLGVVWINPEATENTGVDDTFNAYSLTANPYGERVGVFDLFTAKRSRLYHSAMILSAIMQNHQQISFSAGVVKDAKGLISPYKISTIEQSSLLTVSAIADSLQRLFSFGIQKKDNDSLSVGIVFEFYYPPANPDDPPPVTPVDTDDIGSVVDNPSVPSDPSSYGTIQLDPSVINQTVSGVQGAKSVTSGANKGIYIEELDWQLDNDSAGIAIHGDARALINNINEWCMTPSGTVADWPSWGNAFYSLKFLPEKEFEIMAESHILEKMQKDVYGLRVRGIRCVFESVDLFRIYIEFNIGFAEIAVRLQG